MRRFADRSEAGRRLAASLEFLRGRDIVILGLPRGGVPVAYEVAAALRAPLDVVIVRKLGVPYQPELAMGAIGEGGARVLDVDTVNYAGVTERELEAVESAERRELQRRVTRLRGRRPHESLAGRVAVLVDDGVATGSTIKVACRVVRELGAGEVVIAVPVAPAETVRELGALADQVVCLETPSPFGAVGAWYEDFTQCTDEEVIALLDAADAGFSSAPMVSGASVDERPVVDADVTLGDQVTLRGHLTVPMDALGMVIFAHGSGSSRHSPRNRFVAEQLNGAGIATLLLDLLTPAEEVDRNNVFDIELLADRLVSAKEWVQSNPGTADLAIGYFGASTGAAAALVAAAESGEGVVAVVSRGGRPDLADAQLADVRAPTLLIVGSEDDVVLGLNRSARKRLTCESDLSIIPGATHLFEEPGTLQLAATEARRWFVRQFGGGPAGRS